MTVCLNRSGPSTHSNVVLQKKIIVKILLSVLVSNLKYEDNMYTGAFMAMSGHLFKQIAGGKLARQETRYVTLTCRRKGTAKCTDSATD